MGPFEMVVAIVGIVMFAKVLEMAAKAGERYQNEKLGIKRDELAGRLGQIERRLSNIETILLDSDGRSNNLNAEFERLMREDREHAHH